MARRQKLNEFPFIPIVGATSFYSTGTNTNDIVTTLITPSDAAISHSTIRGITNGATSIVTAAWYSAASKGGSQLTNPHRDVSGNLITLATMANVVFSADYFASPLVFLVEGSRMFFNLSFDQAGTAGTIGIALFLVL